MTSSDDTPPPRRPRPDRDSFYDKHARNNPAKSVVDGGDALPDAVILPSDAETALPTVEITNPETDVMKEIDAMRAAAAGSPDTPQPERTGSTRTDVRSTTDAVVTEPFADTDHDNDRAERAQARSTAEHLTEDPLPYIEPQPTAQLEVDDDVRAATSSAAYSDAAPLADYPAEPVPATGEGEPVVRRGTIDLGLLILRVVVGLVFLGHGLQKLTGWWGGPGIDGFASFLSQSFPGGDPSLGFNPDLARTLALVTGLTETIGGALLILGLLAPVAGAGLFGVILVAIMYRMTLSGGFYFFATDAHGTGLEFELTLAAAVLALTLCGPGTYSLDRRWGWARRPAWGSAGWVIVAIAAAVAAWIVFNGSNPLASA
ncbi:DoxX family membrane protein [Gordonia iterans]